jgi:hypothetical protein
MIPCPSCGKKISGNAKTCPNCGEPEPYIGYSHKKESTGIYLGDKFYEEAFEEIKNKRRQKDKEEWEKRKKERRNEISKNLKRGLIAGVLVMIYYFFRKYWMNP